MGRFGGVSLAPCARHSGRLLALLAIAFACLLVGGGPAGAAKPASDVHQTLSGQAQAALTALQQAELNPADAGAGGFFGRSVAISGSTAVVGAPGQGTDGAGAAYVFTRSAGVWSQQAKLSAAGAAAWDGFGFAVAVSGDTALIGAPGHTTTGGEEAGAAYVFTRSAGVWSQQAKLSAAGAAAWDSFGYAVALVGDAALVGAPYHATSGRPESGAAYVFTRTGATWAQQSRLSATGAAAYDWFGTSVALSGDSALVGADGQGAGAAYVFTRPSAAWVQQAKLVAADGTVGDSFGAAVALSGDAALVGAPSHDVASSEGAGAAYVFSRSGSAWAQDTELNASVAAPGDAFGSSVAISGATAIVGAVARDTSGGADAGSAYFFLRTDGVWSQNDVLTASGGAAADRFGVAVALDRTTTLVGADRCAPGGLDDAGAAYVFTLGVLPLPPLVTGFVPASGVVGSTVTVTGDGFTGATSVTFNGKTASPFTVVSDTELTAKVPAGATTGPIAVTSPLGIGVSTTAFTVTLTPPPPTIAAFTPSSGVVGSMVTLTGAGFTGATEVVFGSAPAKAFTAVSDTELTAEVPRGASTGLIAVTSAHGTGVSTTDFRVTLPQPSITAFVPTSGVVGSTVTVTGERLTGATAVSFNGTAATTFAVVSDTEVTATVPAGAGSGPIAITTPVSTATSTMDFTVTLTPPPPTIVGFTPPSGVVGSTVTLAGAGLTGAASVKFNGIAAPVFTVVSDTRLTAKVPVGATTGRISVTTGYGTAASMTDFRVTRAPAKPALIKLSPATGKRGAKVVIRGKNFGTLRRGSVVTFGGKKCTSYLSWASFRIKCKVPAKAGFGTVKVKVTTAAGQSTTKTFRVKR